MFLQLFYEGVILPRMQEKCMLKVDSFDFNFDFKAEDFDYSGS